MPSMIIGDWCQGLFVWGNLGTSFSNGREDVDVDVIQLDMSAGIALIILCQSVTTDIQVGASKCVCVVSRICQV